MREMLDVPREGGAISGPEGLCNGEEVRSVLLSEVFDVLGDCNLKPDSPEYRRIVGEPDYYEGLHIVARHLVDAERKCFLAVSEHRGARRVLLLNLGV